MSEIKYEIKETIGVLSTSAKGWQKELNLISWNDAAPKYDIREWSPDHEKMGKGITLSNEEFERLRAVINNTKAQLLFVLCVLAISIETTLFCESINKCCSESSKAKMEFSLDEYDMSKKTIVVEKGDTIKTNTIYFFEEKNKQKSKKN